MLSSSRASAAPLEPVTQLRDSLRGAAANAASRTDDGDGSNGPTVDGVWAGLYSGEWSLADLFDHQGIRFLLAERKPVHKSSRELLSRSEFLALVYRAQAYPLKLIAHRCHCSQATASGLVKNACEKLGVNSIVGVAGLFGVGPAELSLKPRDPDLSKWRISSLVHDSGEHVVLSFATPPPYASPVPLSRCQREVLELLLRGYDMARIGKLRSRSRHTIANQIASVYRLLGVNNRLELALLCRGLVP